jgi:hypothetical protein
MKALMDYFNFTLLLKKHIYITFFQDRNSKNQLFTIDRIEEL